ncbi:hypothetical protein FWC31_00495 [Candidatus Saccharibacteria bacterium]|nr:hypothetical protein [Candidatus Saccharibacteria bacterium]
MSVTTPILKPRRYHNIGRRITIAPIFFFIIIATVWAAFNRQFITDQITVWQYDMPPAVEELADDSGMNNHGKFLFHASRPELNDREEFNKNCTMREQQAIVLGCYVARRIYIFDVTDERVKGVRTVTAAHEMLHAAYERLDARERKELNKILEKQLAQTTDQELLDIVKLYTEAEPGQELNELHSLFATNLADLLSELENYYKKYFTDRGRVVAVYQKYHEVFTSLNTRAKELSNSLNDQNAAIAAATLQHERDMKQLASDVSEFNRCAQIMNCFASHAAFDRARAALIVRQNNLQNMADQINAQIEQYNINVAELNALGIEVQKLNQSIDSHAPMIE